MSLVAWGRLLRLSLLPTALADVAAGALWARGDYHGPGSAIGTLMLASLCVYHGGMALNDWADRAQDARTRPARPIPSGAIAPSAALVVGLALLALAPALAFRADRLCGVAMLGVSACAALYDLAGRGAWVGPSLLALCRAGNVGAGVLLGVRHGTEPSGGAVALAPSLALFPLVYGAYVFAVSRVGRLEDAGEPLGRRPAPWILAALACLAASPFLRGIDAPLESAERAAGAWGSPPLEAWQATTLAALLVACAAWSPLRMVLAVREWTGALATAATGMLLRRLLVFTAAAAVSHGSLDGLLVGGAILCGYPASYALRRVFPPS